LPQHRHLAIISHPLIRTGTTAREVPLKANSRPEERLHQFSSNCAEVKPTYTTRRQRRIRLAVVDVISSHDHPKLLLYAQMLGDQMTRFLLREASAAKKPEAVTLAMNVTPGMCWMRCLEILEPTIGLEPMTCRLRIDCSTN
jgi:hypothetical protein